MLSDKTVFYSGCLGLQCCASDPKMYLYTWPEEKKGMGRVRQTKGLKSQMKMKATSLKTHSHFNRTNCS